MGDGDTFVLISGNDLANRDRQHADAIAAAKRAGVGHLVYTSGLRAATESPSAIAASHAVTEAAVRDSGFPFTLLRNGWYTENYDRNLPAVRTTGLLLASVGDARVASASRQDFAQAVGAVVTTDGHLGKTYELSGDVAWNYNDLAAAFSKLLGRTVVYQSVTPHTVDYTGDVVAAVRAIAPQGVDKALHAAGDAAAIGKVVRAGGGVASTLAATAGQLGRDDVTVTGIMAAATADKLAHLLDHVASENLRVNIGARVPLDRAHEASKTFADGTLGKVLVTR